jgi:hypothetical protein
MSITGTIGYYMSQQLPQWQANLRAEAQRYAQLRAASTSMLPQIGYRALELIFRFLSGLLAGLLAGYASHLASDSLAPSSLPVLCYEETPGPTKSNRAAESGRHANPAA